MHPKLEKQFRERAVELGNSGNPAALPELVELTRSPVANVRRLAASAIGKLAGLADAKGAVAALQPFLQDRVTRKCGNMYRGGFADRR